MRWSFAVTLALFAAPLFAAEPKLTSEQVEFFEKKVRPVLAEKCYSCHGEKKQNGGLRLDTAAGTKTGADNGPVIVPGDPAKSRLIASVKRVGDLPMPPKETLSPEAVAALSEWVKLGAPYPADLAKKTDDPRKHWAYQPVKDPPVPALHRASPIDAFIVAKLSDKGLSLAPKVDKRTLIRRAYFDLLGLPPSANEIDAFEKDASPQAYEKLIDKLLASPHYGERWGRYWLDVARYADTKGYVFEEERAFPYAYTYRDYVIRSFNEDKPFDKFIVEQIAADKLPLGEDKSPLAAMGYLTLGRRFLNSAPDIIDDRIDVVSRGFMGLTMSCARCHDHKFDPIPIKDYYSLYGVFASSTEPKELPRIGDGKPSPEAEAFEKEVAKREAAYKADAAKRHSAVLAKLQSPDTMAEYLRAVLEAKGKPERQIDAFVRERDLTMYAFNKWRAYFATQTKGHSRVFSPLVELYAVNGVDFETKAAAVVASLGKDPKKPVHPAVLAALKNTKLKSFRVAAETVAKTIVNARWHQPELRAVLTSGGPLDIPIEDAARVQNRVDRDQLAKARKQIEAFKVMSPSAPPRAHVLNDLPRPQEPVVFLRGNPGNRGPAVPRQFPEILAPNRKPFSDGSGRLELAKAIASPDNPLTARVFVNRVWIGHFGLGLVRTPSDFGVRSDPPTHPELLDWLAKRFVEDGWSVKKLHKRIMLSSAYQQSSVTTAQAFAADPENRLVAHQNRKRLDFEAMRDSLLASAGRIDPAVGGRSVDLFKAPFTTRRSVYGVIDRSNLPGTFRIFDLASPDQHSPQRFQTTVPQQALFLLNSPFVVEQAKALANRAEVKSATTNDAKARALYRAALGRNPTREELALTLEFAGTAPSASAFGPWEQLAQVLLLSNEFAFVD